MPHSFTSKLEQVCRRRRQRRVLTSVCWALASMVMIGLTLIGIDWLLGIADPFGRVLLTALFAWAVLWIVGRCVLSIRDYAEVPLQVAHELEARNPKLRDVIANAWEFANQSDDNPTAGSASLRRAVVLRAASVVEDIDWDAMIPRQALRRGLLALGASVLTISVISWCLPDAMATGVARLVNPLNSSEWPREYDLEFVDPPSLIAAGEDLTLQLRDTGGALPNEVIVYYRTQAQNRWHEDEQPFSIAGNLLEVRRPNVQQSLEYRAVGGDHQTMPWQQLEVVPRPKLAELTITVHPPAYTGLPANQWSSGTAVFAGSKLQLRCRADQPISRAVLRSESGRELVASLDSDEKTIQLASSQWQVEHSDRYQLQLTTLDGVTTRVREEITIDVKVDQPPEIKFVEPTEDLTVVPTAVVPLRIDAHDELALSEVVLAYQRSGQSEVGEQQVTLWSVLQQEGNADATRAIEVEYNLDLTPLNLTPGSVLEIRAQATDAQPMTGQSVRPLRLTVVAESELWQQILDRQAKLVEILAQTLREQRELQQTANQWFDWPAWSVTRWTNSVHAALFRQRQVANTLGGGQSSVLQQIETLIATIERNQLARPDVIKRLRKARAGIQQLVDAALIVAEETINETLRQARRRLDRDTMQALSSQTKTAQREVVEGLESIIDLLVPGNVMGRLERKLADLETDQRKLGRRCQDEVAKQFMQPTDEKLERQELLGQVVREQRQLAGRFASFQLELSQTADRLADEEPSLALRLAETDTRAEELGTQSTMQSAADHLARRRVGKAIVSQQTVIDDLAILRELLAGQDAVSKRERLDQLRSAERDLQRLRRQTRALEGELEKLSTDERKRELERLRRERKELAKKTEQMTRRLERLTVPQAAKPAAEATAALQRAKLDGPTTKQARKKLDAAQQALTTERRRQQVTLARLQMAQLDAKLKVFVGLQQAIVMEINRLDSLQKQRSELTLAEQQSVVQLADRQAILRDDVNSQADALESLPVFSYLLGRAAATMGGIESRLQNAELGQGTQVEAETAVRQLTQISESIKKEQKELADAKEGAGGSSGQDAGDTPQAQTLQLALGQLKLLKSLQVALQDETRAMELANAAGQPLGKLAEELAIRQQELAELAQQLVPEPPDPPTEDLIPSLEQELEKSFDDLLLREVE